MSRLIMILLSLVMMTAGLSVVVAGDHGGEPVEAEETEQGDEAVEDDADHGGDAMDKKGKRKGHKKGKHKKKGKGKMKGHSEHGGEDMD